MLKHLKIILPLSLLFTVGAFFTYGAFEPQLANAITASDSVVITLVVNKEITITSPADSSMSTNLGLAQNTAVGTTTWNVKTNDSTGYTMAVQATSAPAMQSGAFSITDYQTNAPNLWSATSGNAYFGYSAFGSDTLSATWGTDTDCYGATNNSISTGLKYQGFKTSAGTNIASHSATTTSAGVDTTVCYAVEQNAFFIPAGTYTATITATATGV